jgi:hypothetical protein
MDVPAADHDGNDPVTLHRIMQTMIGEGLRERYQAPQKLSHGLFVLLMQLNEREREAKGRAIEPRSAARRQSGGGQAPSARAND